MTNNSRVESARSPDGRQGGVSRPPLSRSRLQCEALIRPYYRGRTDRLPGGWTRDASPSGQPVLVAPSNWGDWQCARRATRRITISGEQYLVCWQHRRASLEDWMVPKQRTPAS